MKTRIIFKQGDITNESVDAIVNAANSTLLGGGGVDGAIHRAAGPALLAACKEHVAQHGPCAPGAAVATSAGNLSAKFVIHTVGPVWKGGSSREAEILASSYRNSLELAESLACSSVAFPAISTGVYRYPIEEAAAVAIGACEKFVLSRGADTVIEEIRFILFSKGTMDVFERKSRENGE